MVSAGWAEQLESASCRNGICRDTSAAEKVSVLLSVPDEKQLWESSPWYGDNATHAQLSSTQLGARRYAPVCDPTSPTLQRVSDDSWLYRRWLEDLEEERHQPESSDDGAEGSEGEGAGCFEIGTIHPQVTLNQGETVSHIPDDLFMQDRTKCGYGLIRLPHFDASGEEMEDPDILLDDAEGIHGDDEQQRWQQDRERIDGAESDTTVSEITATESTNTRHNLQQHHLRGLNSNSHSFPWGGKNTYPRFFESGVLVVRRGSVRLDGIVVAHGGCGQDEEEEAEEGHSSESRRVTDGLPLWASSPVAEFHYGGCGCCPLGHGEIGKTFETKEGDSRQAQESGGGIVKVLHLEKVVTVVQRFHHGRSSPIDIPAVMFCCSPITDKKITPRTINNNPTHPLLLCQCTTTWYLKCFLACFKSLTSSSTRTAHGVCWWM
jgi:hypothetical protein